MKLRVLLVQLPVPNNPLTNTPLAAGYLKAYAHSQGLLDRAQIDVLPRALADHAGDALLLKTIVEYAPDLLGFSLYTWNSERSLDIAFQVRSRLPHVRIVVGGPEVQHDNAWLCEHPALDFGIIGEGEQAFVDLLRSLISAQEGQAVRSEVWSDQAGHKLRHGSNIADLSTLPSPYLLGYLALQPESMLMVEVTRWCPYSCSFCLYGRNMGSKLGKRFFPLERLLAEIGYGREQGIERIHFIEANLNLVPIFQPLMQALSELNADGSLALYAELRGEHLSDEVVQALALAGLREAEVGLQSANPEALRAVQRRTDLSKWAAGTRRLYAHGIDVLLDVIIGLPLDDEHGLETTLDFIAHEQLGAYDAFTLQLLPGTALRQQAARFGLRFQERPPYYVLETDRMDFATLRRLRRSLKERAGVDADAIEGCPLPRYSALQSQPIADSNGIVCHVDLRSETRQLAQTSEMHGRSWPAIAGAARGHVPPALHVPEASIQQKTATQVCEQTIQQLASHVDILASWEELQAHQGWLDAALQANPSTIFDIYISSYVRLPDAEELRQWRAQLPYQPGYLDRIAVYQLEKPEPSHMRVSPRLFLLVPWVCDVEPNAYAGCAVLIWEYQLGTDEDPPLAAWQAAGGGIWVRGRSAAQVAAWREQTGLQLWQE